MRQPSLFELVRPAHASSATTTCSTTEPLEVYDFFAGAGGFSTGAAQAGCRVVYACDNNEEALATHKRNHPETEHACLTLPSDEAVAKLPTDGRRFHVHCSPPCVKLSRINTPNVVAGNAGSRGMAQAADMVEWCLEMMLASQCTSWSLEQVGDHSVQTIVERVRKRHPIAPRVRRAQARGAGRAADARAAHRRDARAAGRAAAQGLEGQRAHDAQRDRQPRGTHVRSGRSIIQVRKRLNRKKGETMWINARAGWEDWCTSIDKPAPTVRAKHTHAWVTLKDGKAVSHCRMSAQRARRAADLPSRLQVARAQAGGVPAGRQRRAAPARATAIGSVA